MVEISFKSDLFGYGQNNWNIAPIRLEKIDCSQSVHVVKFIYNGCSQRDTRKKQNGSRHYTRTCLSKVKYATLQGMCRGSSVK